jgi:orotate phosphoribosyltransferase
MKKKHELAEQIRQRALISGTFTLRSGTTSNAYFDKYLFESDPQILRAIAEEMADLLPPQTQVLAGLELGGIPVVTALSQVTGLPAAFIRKQAKTYGTCKYAEGADLHGRQVTLIEDVVSTGGAIIDTLNMLRADAIEPATAICIIDRETGGFANLQDNGLELRSVFTMTDIVGTLRP